MKNLSLRTDMLIKRSIKEIINKTRDISLVHVVSFPKSGRTWLRLMLAKIYSEITGFGLQDILNSEKKSCLFSEFRGFLRKNQIPYLVFEHGFQVGEIVKGDYFPKQYYKNKKVLFLVRDPRDTLISYYYHEKYHFNSFNGSLHEFVHFPFEKFSFRSRPALFGIKPIINYMNTWVQNISLFGNFYAIYYEDFQKNTLEQLNLASDYIGLKTNQTDISKAVAFGNFKNMRRMEKENTLKWYPLSGTKNEKGLKVRQGTVGGYKTELRKDDLEFINQEISKCLNPYFKRYINTGL